MFIKIFKISRLKIIFVISLAFIISSYLDKNLFIAHTPHFNNPINSISKKIYELIYIAKFGEEGKKIIEASRFPSASTLENMKQVIYQPMVKFSDGVYAQIKGNVVKVTIKEEEIEWVEYTYNLKNGQKIKVKVPKGQTPPSKEIYED